MKARSNLARARDLALVAAAGAVVVLGARNLPVSSTHAAATASAPTSSAEASAPLPAGASATPVIATPKLDNDACVFDDPGEGDAVKRNAKPFVVWVRSTAVRPDDRYDLHLHIHGGEAARRLTLGSAYPLVLATIDLGPLSGDYRGAFPDRKTWDASIAAIDRTVSEAIDREVKADRILVSSFSAGYGAVGEILTSLGDEAPPSGVILLDSLHASYKASPPGEVEPVTLEPFLGYARRSLEGRGFFALTHSAIVPPGYASTSEVATYFLRTLAVEATPLDAPAQGLALRRVAGEKGFILRGYAGEDKGAHCAHLTLLPELIEAWIKKR